MSRLFTENLSVGYGENLIVKNMEITIPDQKITAIIGANGCGKSTLLKTMTRIITTDQGKVVLDGASIHTQNTKELAQKLAILPQTPESMPDLTVGELVSYGRFPYQKGLGRLTKHDKVMIDWALEVTNTLSYKHESVDALSGGQRQRVWIAMALAQDTEIIFLDEPTTYLDMAHQLEILELLQYLNQTEGRTIVMVLHDINQAARFADYMVAMKQGEIVKTGSPDDVVCHDVLRRVFHIDASVCQDPCSNRPMCMTYNLIKQSITKQAN
ncbi:putative siderophore transport system ATP-binding protein YusV [Paraliobacillus sp. PM-2]|uniref:ABC transporter ATP-binding protein n=1 Tax=Paraliobacillus sp. PM-2 TaxID=1462524 RepID=UPI00061BF454|nr:ABC transporter ATP-binding protein [Paraliobacillus sp. PM-2]CQR48424.1 putative siderophore transport system ATP-binding protein YusV [Paraliobacillus sp. PM-2]